MGFWYHLFIAKLLYYHRGKSTYKAIMDTKVKIELSYKLSILIRIFSYPILYQIFKYIIEKILGGNKELQFLLKKIKPVCVIYPSVLTGPFISELPREARAQGIKSIICMNSWDNPMSKAIQNELPDYLIVWGQDSKIQSMKLLGVPEKIIYLFGAAQFEIYKKKSNLTKEMLIKKFKVPENKRYILYAGVGESFKETKFLNLLENAIEKKFLKNTHIIYRPHPWRGRLQDEEVSFFEMDYKNITMDPHMIDYYMKAITKPDRKFFMIDYSITRDLLQLVSGVISPRSTVLLEGAILGKHPFVLFPEEIENIVFSKENIHFQTFCSLSNVISCFNISNFDDKIKIYDQTLNDFNISNTLKKDTHSIVNMSGESYGKKLKSLIEDIL